MRRRPRRPTAARARAAQALHAAPTTLGKPARPPRAAIPGSTQELSQAKPNASRRCPAATASLQDGRRLLRDAGRMQDEPQAGLRAVRVHGPDDVLFELRGSRRAKERRRRPRRRRRWLLPDQRSVRVQLPLHWRRRKEPEGLRALNGLGSNQRSARSATGTSRAANFDSRSAAAKAAVARRLYASTRV